MVGYLIQRSTIPPLENGDRLNRFEFERCYDAMPHLKKAEPSQWCSRIYCLAGIGAKIRLVNYSNPDLQCL
jgi:hypothetical protein